MSTPDFSDILRAIRALADLHGTASTHDESLALGAAQRGRAAFWTTAGYSNQIAGILLTAANQRGIPAALAECADDLAGDYRRRAEYLLGTLIPLNREAHVAINSAWQAMAETAETIRRARAARPAPMFNEVA